MKASKLKIGDKIKIYRVAQLPFIDVDTIGIFRKLAARKRPVRICKIGRDSIPYYRCQYKKDGKLKRCFMAVFDVDKNWKIYKE
jgi:hypothetical protein